MKKSDHRGRREKVRRTEGGLPSKQEIMDFLRSAGTKAGKREITKAFNLKSDDRIALKALLAEMTEEGLLTGNRKGFKEKGGLPPVAVLEITGRDPDGDLMAEPTHFTENLVGHRHRRLGVAATVAIVAGLR